MLPKLYKWTWDVFITIRLMWLFYHRIINCLRNHTWWPICCSYIYIYIYIIALYMYSVEQQPEVLEPHKWLWLFFCLISPLSLLGFLSETPLNYGAPFVSKLCVIGWINFQLKTSVIFLATKYWPVFVQVAKYQVDFLIQKVELTFVIVSWTRLFGCRTLINWRL